MINIVLYQPEIPQNTGNIMRTCCATNSKLHLIKPLGFNMDEKSLKRSGVNYINNCNYQIYENIDDFFKLNQGTFYFLTRYGKKPPAEFDFSKDKNIYFIFGKESKGIPKEILRPYLENCIRLPMTNKVRSLNLANTVAIITYEALRQNNYEGLLFEEPHKSSDYLIEN